MDNSFINLTSDNIDSEHLCCLIRKNDSPGIAAKREWIKNRLSDGHVFRKLDADGCAFIEYAPLEKAWVPIEGDNFYYIYCLWCTGHEKGRGYGSELIEYCINEAKEHGKSGICMLGAKKQKLWLSDISFAKKYGFECVDTACGEYELLCLSFDGTVPRFTKNVKDESNISDVLTIYYSDQCPYIYQRINKLKVYCKENSIEADFIHIDSLEQAKALPCVFNNWAVTYHGKFITVNQVAEKGIEKIIERY